MMCARGARAAALVFLVILPAACGLASSSHYMDVHNQQRLDAYSSMIAPEEFDPSEWLSLPTRTIFDDDDDDDELALPLSFSQYRLAAAPPAAAPPKRKPFFAVFRIIRNTTPFFPRRKNARPLEINEQLEDLVSVAAPEPMIHAETPMMTFEEYWNHRGSMVHSVITSGHNRYDQRP
jgi:hypothetical protein